MKYVLLSCMVMAGCAADGERPDKFASLQAGAKSVCEVTGDPSSYLGRRILVHGIYFGTPHERMLHDPECPDSGLRVSLAPAEGDRRAEAMVKRLRKQHPTVTIPVVYSRHFQRQFDHSGLHDAELLRLFARGIAAPGHFSSPGAIGRRT